MFLTTLKTKFLQFKNFAYLLMNIYLWSDISVLFSLYMQLCSMYGFILLQEKLKWYCNRCFHCSVNNACSFHSYSLRNIYILNLTSSSVLSNYLCRYIENAFVLFFKYDFDIYKTTKIPCLLFSNINLVHFLKYLQNLCLSYFIT